MRVAIAGQLVNKYPDDRGILHVEVSFKFQYYDFRTTSREGFPGNDGIFLGKTLEEFALWVHAKYFGIRLLIGRDYLSHPIRDLFCLW